jgi:hypothetical protein
VRRQHNVHTERADKLFKRLDGARLDDSYEDERRKLHRRSQIRLAVVAGVSQYGADDVGLGLEPVSVEPEPAADPPADDAETTR